MKDEIASAVAKAAPPVVVSGASALFDLTINDYVGLATLLYIGLQVFVLLRKMYADWMAK
ncbi:MAG: hypothetical protein V4633_13595 [Pseudomonadota bacterium]